MCGIAGVMYGDRSRAVSPQLLASMAAIQHHRGPDGFGVKTIPEAGIGFSHARLSIIDLDENRSRQPFISEDNRLLMAHNGEFYDYKRIRTLLTASGAKFRTKSDSEILLHLYPRYGLEKTLESLRGEFAFSLYDRDEDTLYLVRDRFGIKPLYWTCFDNQFVFGSELKVIFANPEVKREMNAEGVYHQLMQTIVPGSTAFDNIHQVQPGHYIKIQRRNGNLVVEQKKYWDVDFPLKNDRPVKWDDNEYIEGVRDHLMHAVHLRLEADVPVASYLSGGIDSCSILGLAAAAQQSPVKAFTISFDDSKYDESVIAREMAESVGADHDIMRLDASHLYDHFVDTLWFTERTIYNTLGVAKLLMSRHVNKSNYKVVVTGEGSDELFAGYPAFRKDMFLHGMGDLPAKDREEWSRLLHESNKQFSGAMLAKDELNDPALTERVGFTPSCLQPWLACGNIVADLMNSSLQDELKGYSPGSAIAATLDREYLEGRHALDKAQYVWIKTMLEGQILTWGGDRVDMANSMEARPAFLDHHLAEYATSIPPTMRIKGPTEKYVLREAMKGLLPKTLYEREKFAFMAPPAHTDPKKLAAIKTLVNEYLNKDAIHNSGLLDYNAVNNLFKGFESGHADNAVMVQMDAIVNHLVGIQVLHEHFVSQDVPQLAQKRAEQLGWQVQA